MYGAPALKVRGKLLACMASHKSAEPGSLVVRIGFDEREALIADDPRVYYVKPHVALRDVRRVEVDHRSSHSSDW